MIQYWYYTGDTSNNAAILQGMNWQSGGHSDFFTSNYSQYIGNDDQQIWALAAMTAAELDFPQQPSKTAWITMAENVFNEQIQRWDTTSCGGGLRWQIYPYGAGYTVKNAISNGHLFELSARLARYTNNQTYSDWAEKIWDWSAKTLMNTTDWTVYDSVETSDDCKTKSGWQSTFNYGPFIRGDLYMYNLVSNPPNPPIDHRLTRVQTDSKVPKWERSLQGLLTNSVRLFFPKNYGGDILTQVDCETIGTCDTFQIALKGSFAQALASVAILAPQAAFRMLPLLQGSAVAAAKTCTGGADGTECGTKWYTSTYDGTTGMAQDLSATSLFTANLVAFEKQPPGTQANAVNETAAGTSTSAGVSTGSGNGTSTTATGSAGAAATATDANAGNVINSGLTAVVAGVVGAIVALA